MLFDDKLQKCNGFLDVICDKRKIPQAPCKCIYYFQVFDVAALIINKGSITHIGVYL